MERTIYELRCQMIHDIGFDYDGCYNSASDLRDIIDELVAIASGKKDKELLELEIERSLEQK